VSVGAVVFDGARVLLVKRGQAPLKGAWSLPGGVVELGETLAEALVREVLEETGIDIEVGPVIDVLDRVERTPDLRVEYHYVIIDYFCRARAGTAMHGSDAEDVCWAAIEDLAAFRLTGAVTTVVEKALELVSRNL
jgi:mutator protein MutT